MKLLVFDTETTGLPQTKIINPETFSLWPSIVQLSYIVYDSSQNKIIEAKDFIVKHPESISISEESTKIHGITNEIINQRGIPIESVFCNFFNSLRNSDSLIGHNVNFDINMVKIELLRLIHNNSLPRRQIKSCKYDLHFLYNFKEINCTLKDSIQLCNIQATDKYGKVYLKYPQLGELHEKLFEKKPNNLHNSFNDILVTLRCFMKLKYNIDLVNTCNTFKKYLINII